MNIKDILKQKKYKFTPKGKSRGSRPDYVDAQKYVQIFGIPYRLAMRLVKKHGCSKLDSVMAWWKDYPSKRNGKGLLIWKLNQ